MEKWVGAIIAVVFIVILGFAVYKLFGKKLIPYIADKVEDGVAQLMTFVNPKGGNKNVILPHAVQAIVSGFNDTLTALL